MAARKRKTSREIPDQDTPDGASRVLDENIRVIRTWERAAVHHRSGLEQLGDAITQIAASGPVLVLHVLWFTLWVLANSKIFPGIEPFDPFPFPFLTMTVSLEAIFLSLFVLASQNRMTQQADKRAQMDLQIDLLAEREMTVVLRLLQDIAAHLEIPLSVTSDQIRDLVKKVDVQELTARIERLNQASGTREERQSTPTRRRVTQA